MYNGMRFASEMMPCGGSRENMQEVKGGGWVSQPLPYRHGTYTEHPDPPRAYGQYGSGDPYWDHTFAHRWRVEQYTEKEQQDFERGWKEGQERQARLDVLDGSAFRYGATATAARIAELRVAKAAAVEAEEYMEAQRLKEAIGDLLAAEAAGGAGGGQEDGGGETKGDDTTGGSSVLASAVTASALDALLRAGVEFAPCVDYAQAKKGYQYREGTQGLGYYLQPPQGAGGTSTQSAKAADGGDGGGGSSSDSSDRGGAGAAGAAAAAAGGGGSSPASLLCDTTERDQSDMVALKRSYQAAQLLANQQNNDTLLTFLAKKTGVIATTMFAGFEGDSGGNMFHICMVLDKLLKQHTDALLTTLCESTERIEQSFAVMMRHLHHAPVGKLIADLACTPASSMMSDE